MTTATAVKERGILFSAAMVRALLDGRKTQHRILPPRQPHAADDKPGVFYYSIGRAKWTSNERFTETFKRTPDGDVPISSAESLLSLDEWMLELSPYKVGMQLWVREKWYPAFKRTPTSNGCVYAADDDGIHLNPGWKPHDGWRSASAMPRWASRITLEITDVRVQRLMDISEADAIAEGSPFSCPNLNPEQCGCRGKSARDWFNQAWESINGPDSWSANPFVWAISFKVIK